MASPDAARPQAKSNPPRYGEFPELFWDLKPDVEVDVEQPFVLARLLTQARPEVIWRLVPISVIRRHLPTLPIPEHSRAFWGMVLEAIDRRRADQGFHGA